MSTFEKKLKEREERTCKDYVVYSVRERERERSRLGKVGRMDTVRSSIMPKEITDRERSNSAGKRDSAGNRAGPRRANIS